MPFSAERVPASETFQLRLDVLRPGHAIEQIALPGEDGELVGSFVVRDPDTGEPVSTGSVWPEPPPWIAGSPTHAAHSGHAPYELPAEAAELTGSDGARCWRLRGMATTESRRGEGLGGAVVAAIIDHATSNGGALIWCNARERAIPFYEREGFAGLGERFDEPGIGTHIVMWRPLGAGGDAEQAARRKPPADRED